MKYCKAHLDTWKMRYINIYFIIIIILLLFFKTYPIVLFDTKYANEHYNFTQNECNMKRTWQCINGLISHKKVTKLHLIVSALIIILLLINWKFQISLINILLLSDLN